MNLALGSCSVGELGSLFDDLLRAAEETLQIRPEAILAPDEDRKLAVAGHGDGGSILGRAQQDGLALIYIGAVTHPMASWRGSASPLDDADTTARHLLDRYRAVDKAFLDDVTGSYALAVVDRRQERALLAVDPWGGRSWFVREQQGMLTFSSHLLALARSEGSRLAIDRGLEDFFLLYGFYPFGRTPFAGIRSLPPGTLLEWRRGETTSTRISPANPWQERVEALDSLSSEAEVSEHLYRALLQATKEQLPTRRQRVAVLLGGFDSALVAALIRRLGFDVDTYSFHYEEAHYNQPHTEALARFLDGRHHWLEIDRDMIDEGIRNFSRTFNQPTNWPNYVIQTARLCERMRANGIRHCYSGDGCDAVFLGYPGTYQRARVFGSLPAAPRWLHRALVALAARPSLDRLFGHPYRVALNVLRGMGREMPARGYLSFRVLDELSLRLLRKGLPPAAEKSIEELLAELSAPFASLPILRLAYQGKAAVSPNRNKLIGSSDLTGVTILAPYMHPGLKSLALALPETLMRPAKKTKSKVTGKYILMKMAESRQLLPNAIIYQPKMAAVDGPIDRWYAGPLRSTLLEVMRGLPFQCEASYLNRLLDLKLAESLFKHFVMTDKVISHATSLLATYASFTSFARSDE